MRSFNPIITISMLVIVSFVPSSRLSAQNLELLATYQEEGFDVLRVVAKGDRAFVASLNQLRILDISTPSNPALLHEIDFEFTIADIAINDKYVYIVETNEIVFMPNKFYVVDVDGSNPSTQELDIAFGFRRAELTLSGSKMLVMANGRHRNYEFLLVVDLDETGIPQSAHPVNFPQIAAGSALDDPIAYVLMELGHLPEYKGFMSLDISDSAHPEILNILHLPIAGNLSNVGILDNLAFIANGNFGLQIVDISDPDYLVLSGASYIPFNSSDVLIYNRRVYVADSEGKRILVFRGDQPNNPDVVGFLALPEEPYRITTNGNLFFATGGTNGLFIMKENAAESKIINKWQLYP